MSRRGPDGEGEWCAPGVWLGHRRLSIIDLDARAGQPLHSGCGRYVIIFNGEIYNYQELRSILAAQGVCFKTTSDTEVVVELFAREGAAMLPRLRGMFALVIWDRVSRAAFVARDPYGIKPLYYARTPQGIVLASQVKALIETGLPSRAPSPRGQATFWMLGHVAEPWTWYRDIQALPAGSQMWIRDGVPSAPAPWFDVAGVFLKPPSSHVFTEDEVQERVRAAVCASTRAHLAADVPVGVFLSGGIDSSVLGALMAERAQYPVQAVTLAFGEFAGTGNDERPGAQAVAEVYGLKHYVRAVTRDEFTTDSSRIIAAMDQPSVDGINTWYASKAAAEVGLKVVVSGVGGDELFQGYRHFQQLPRLVSAWRRIVAIPGGARVSNLLLRQQARRTRNARWNYLGDWSRTISGAWWLRRGLYSPSDLPQLMGHDLAQEALCEFSPDAWVADMTGSLSEENMLALGQIESTTYLRNQLLRDSDWASMDHGVEMRTPFVDATLLTDCAPMLSQFARFPGKSLLARAPSRALPREITERKKTGFSIPVQSWLAEPGHQSGLTGTRSWAKELVRLYESQS